MARDVPVDPLTAIVGDSDSMKEVYRLTRLVAPTRVCVLLVGETGTGKELVARAIHQLSSRQDAPYIRVNCGALTESLLESELFGHVKGAFTGAIENKTGRFEAAHGGTIFLDEISSMSPTLQVKLLRVLQESEFERVGESRTIEVDARVIAATNQFLEDEIEAGNFREDLYYRLNVVPIYLPPLRERGDDIPKLGQYFLDKAGSIIGREPPSMSPEFEKMLSNHPWPGNVRELENYIARVVVLSEGKPLGPDTVPAPGSGFLKASTSRKKRDDLESLVRQLVLEGVEKSPEGKLCEEIVGRVERELIKHVVRDCNGTQTEAARRLGINRNTLHKKLTEYDK